MTTVDRACRAISCQCGMWITSFVFTNVRRSSWAVTVPIGAKPLT
jgi:hypothetical protein